MKKPESLPLRTPDGELLAWACGLCRRVCASAGTLMSPDEEIRANLAEHYLYDADACCTCRRCGTVGPDITYECEACREKQRAKEEAERPSRLAAEAARESTFDKSKDPNAARALAHAMGELSEDCWCAYWLIGCEYTLWSFVLNGPGEWGAGHVSDADLKLIRDWSDRAGGWVIYRDGAGKEFVPMDKWIEMYRNDMRRREPTPHENAVSDARATIDKQVYRKEEQ